MLALPFTLIGCDGEQSLANANATRLRVAPLEQVLTLEVRREPPCALLSGVTATQNGVALRRLSVGKRSQPVFVDFAVPAGPAVCEGPTWEMLPSADIAPVTIVVEDASARIIAEVPTEQPADAGFNVVEPASAIAHPGERVTVEWTPTNDVLLAAPWSVRIATLVGGGAYVFNVTADGSRLSFAVPAADQFSVFGPAELVIVGPADRHFTRCEGVPACTSPFNARNDGRKASITISP